MRFADLSGGQPEDANAVRYAHPFPGGANFCKRTSLRTLVRPSEYDLIRVREQVVDGQAEIRKCRCIGLQQRRSPIQSLEHTIGRIDGDVRSKELLSERVVLGVPVVLDKTANHSLVLL